jgi:hypothetical protein
MSIYIKRGGFRIPILVAIPLGNISWLNRGLEARSRFNASSVLNSIRSRLVRRKKEEKATISTGNINFVL